MKNITTGANIFSEILNAFDKFGLDLSTLCGIVTDGARAMYGTGIGFVGLLKSALKEKNISDNIAIFHCIVHLQNLCAKSLKFKHAMGSFELEDLTSGSSRSFWMISTPNIKI